MANIIHIDNEGFLKIIEWVDKNKALFTANKAYNEHYFNNCILSCEFYETPVICYFEAKNNKLKYYIKKENTKLVSGSVFDGTKIGNDLEIRINLSSEMAEFKSDIEQIVKNAINAYYSINTFLCLGNIAEDRNVLISKSVDTKKDHHYFVKSFNDNIYIINTDNHHQSPSGIFSVRGHFRRYKNGKVIWISDYIKGKKAILTKESE